MNNHICRAKRKDTGEWVYGNYVSIPGKYFIITKYRNSFSNGAFELYNEVDPNTVCSFTGLYDDSGEEIYDNDILVVDSEYKAIALWCEDSAAFIVNYLNHTHNGGWDYLSDCNCEVIGSDIDDPELFETTDMWRVTFFERYELHPLRSIMPNYGGIRICEYYSKYETALKALHESDSDPDKSICDYAILEKIDEDFATVVACTKWFGYDYKRGGHFEIEAPGGNL